MSLFAWDARFELGIQLIDDQHKQLVNILSNLFDSMRVGLGFKQVESTIEQLRDYSIFHFTDEEEYMKKVNFPKYFEHNEAHKYFIEMVDDFAKRYKDGDIAITLKILDFLKNWLTNHILTADKEFADHVAKN